MIIESFSNVWLRCFEQISCTIEGKENLEIEVENANVVEMMKKWYLGGTRGVSPTTISSLANNICVELSK